jgi:hypothetical protein
LVFSFLFLLFFLGFLTILFKEKKAAIK